MQGKNQQNCSVSLENGVETTKKSETVAGFASFGHPQTSSASVKVHHTRPCRHPVPRTPASRAAAFSFRQKFRRAFRCSGRNCSSRHSVPRSTSHTCPHCRSKTGASSATISRVNRALNYGVEGYHQVFARVLGDECVPPTAEKGRKAGRKKKTEDA